MVAGAVLLGFTFLAPGTVGPKTETAAASESTGTVMTFAVIGDFGTDNSQEASVASMVASWDPAFIITTGDDYYRSAGGTETGRYDESVGRYYRHWLAGITTTDDGAPSGEATVNAFFPSMGNHDLTDALPAPDTYFDYFDLPGEGFVSSSGNERYYDFVQGPVHFFALDSNPSQPDGIKRNSKQARWLRRALARSTSTWNIVYDHHPPYSSGVGGSNRYLRWPYASWGADAMLSGHHHTYERVMRGSMPFFVNGLGGARRQFFGPLVDGSAVRFAENWGAQKVTVSSSGMCFEFYDVSGVLWDSYTLTPTVAP